MEGPLAREANRLDEMAAVVAVAREGSLSGAARALGLTPSAVSRIVARVEARLRVRLMLRTTRRLSLTAEGERYARAAQRILEELEAVEEAIAGQAAPRGRVRVSTAAAHGRLVVVPLLGEFVARYPEISVEIDLSDQLADVLGGGADLAIRFGPLADSPLTARRLGETGHRVVASPAYLERAGMPRHPDELARHNCLDFSFPRLQPGWPFRVDGRDYVMRVRGNMASNNGETLVQLALQGVGITRIGNFHVDEEIAAGRLVPLLEDYNPQDRESIHAVFIGGATMPVRLRVLLEFLTERMRRPAD